MNEPTFDPSPIRVGLISLGCAKNLVDAEIMLGNLLKEGVEIINQPGDADVVIVNTCSFIDAAQEESVDTILESAEIREARNRHQGLVVSGCLSQRFRDELPKLFPEVDAFMGIDQVGQVGTIVRAALSRRRQKLQPSAPKGRTRRKQITHRLAVLGADENDAGRVAGRTQDGASTSAAPRKTVATPRTHGASRSSSGRDETDTQRKGTDPVVRVDRRPTYIPDYETPRFRLTPQHFAYVKIAEGCNHPCSFCIIPRMRGSHRSRAQNDVVNEVKQLLKEGVKEINLISQDSTYYGLDLRPGHRRSMSSPERFGAATRSLGADAATLCTLLRELNALRGDFWIRILYTHPAHWTDELIRTIADCRKVARYVDIPLQHIHENMLERMRRETSRAYIEDLLARIRAGVPGITLRTTFIVGFPGETKACFESLLNFIRETKFERLGVFTYSKEEGTRAGAMAGQIGRTERERRREQAMAEQHAVAVQVSESYVGHRLKVLVEGKATARQLQQANVSSWEHGLIRHQDTDTPQLKGRYLVARSEADAPDIDGRVFVKGKLPIGRFARVKVVGHTDYDLIAEPA